MTDEQREWHVEHWDIAGESGDLLVRGPDALNAEFMGLKAAGNTLNALEQELRDARAEREALLRSLEIARFAPVGDNHHNAAACPYCRSWYDDLQARLQTMEQALRDWKTLAVDASFTMNGVAEGARLLKRESEEANLWHSRYLALTTNQEGGE